MWEAYGVEERGVFVVGETVMESEALVDTAKLPLSSCVVCDSFFLFLASNFVRFYCVHLCSSFSFPLQLPDRKDVGPDVVVVNSILFFK